MKDRFIITGALFGAIAVILGAFGAHALKDTLTPDSLRVFHTGVEYQFYHAFAMIICGIIKERRPSRLINWSGSLFLAGIILFPGSLYCLSLFDAMSFVGIVTPFGGLAFIAGWITLAISQWKRNA